METYKNKTIYLIGIKGVGMAALAVYFKEAGAKVYGSDTSESFVTDKILENSNISFFSSFDGKNLKSIKPDLVIVSASYGKENPEVNVAKKRHLNVKYYSETLGEITKDKKLIAVAGVHGKTTVAAMMAHVLDKAGFSPSFIVGAGHLANFKTNAKYGEGDYFVAEADEYRKSPVDNAPKFLDLSPQIAIITSIEFDHPDVFPNIEEIYNAFYRLACRVPRNGLIVLCTDYPKARKMLHSLVDKHYQTYGFGSDADWQIIDLKEEENDSIFSLKKDASLAGRDAKIYGPYKLKTIGKHNVLNATAAIITASYLEIADKVIKIAIESFLPVGRRYEIILNQNDLVIIDDYAHHPTAIKTTLEATRNRFPKSKIWCVFQPHTYSRTEKLLNEFARAFKDADKVIITDIYASAREKEGNVSGADLAFEIKKYQTGVRHISDIEKVKDFLLASVNPPAVILTIGAGDIYKLALELKKNFKKG